MVPDFVCAPRPRFLEKALTRGMDILHRRAFSVYDYAMVLFSIISGFASAIKFFVLSVVRMLVQLLRIDKSRASSSDGAHTDEGGVSHLRNCSGLFVGQLGR